jgi:excisionase family DNA binding protein
MEIYLMKISVTSQRIAWSLAEVAESTGLSLGFLRKDVRRGALPVRRFGRRVLVLKEDLENYLLRGSQKDSYKKVQEVSQVR